MTPITIDKKSFHYKLAHGVGYREWHDSNDICSYSRHVVLGGLVGLFVLTMITLLTIFVSYLLVSMGLTLYFAIFHGVLIPDDFALAGFMLLTFAALYLLAIWGYKLISRGYNKVTNIIETKEDTFVSNAYRAYKDKFCVKLQFISEESDE